MPSVYLDKLWASSFRLQHNVTSLKIKGFFQPAIVTAFTETEWEILVMTDMLSAFILT